jgi:hypothetical protein
MAEDAAAFGGAKAPPLLFPASIILHAAADGFLSRTDRAERRGFFPVLDSSFKRSPALPRSGQRPGDAGLFDVPWIYWSL